MFIDCKAITADVLDSATCIRWDVDKAREALTAITHYFDCSDLTRPDKTQIDNIRFDYKRIRTLIEITDDYLSKISEESGKIGNAAKVCVE